MKMISLNIRGFEGDLKIRLLRELIQKENIDFVSLQETVLPDDVSGIVKCLCSLREFSFCSVPVMGRSGGFTLFIEVRLIFSYLFIFWDGFLGVIGH